MPPARDLVVTSFSAEGAARYGNRCVESVVRHWPHPLDVYLDSVLPMPVGVRVDLTGEIPGYEDTRRRLPRQCPGAEKPSNYIWDAQRFAVKPFVWLAAAERLEHGILTWLDADTVVTAAVPTGLPAALLGDADVAFLGRGEMHPETGFVAFRIPEALDLLRWCVECYQSGEFLGFEDGWTDCHVLRAGLFETGAPARDLTSHLAAVWNSRVDAMALSPLGGYVTHYKGSRKKEAACAI
jgi:hypothetical protein